MKALKGALADTANSLSEEPERSLNKATEHSMKIPKDKYISNLITFMESPFHQLSESCSGYRTRHSFIHAGFRRDRTGQDLQAG